MQYYQLFLPLAILLVLSKMLMKVCGKIGLPSVIGMLLAGVFMGFIKYIPGQTVFTDVTMTGFGFIAKIGVVLILFSSGLETELSKIKKIGGSALIITCAGVLVPMALGFVVAVLFHGGFAGLTKDTALTCLFYGTILTATSVSISVQTLRELGKLDTTVGTTIVTAAIIDDILGIVVLSFVLAMKDESTGASPLIIVLKTIAYFAVISVIAFIASKAFKALDKRFPHHRLIPISSLALCFLVAYISERYFGIADITGAYVVGLILSTNSDSKYIDAKADILGYMIFVPVFFGNIGISTEFSSLNMDILFFGLLFVLVGMVGKVVGCGLTARACGYNTRDSLKIGVGMMARAEVALVTAQKGVEFGVIDNSIMPFIVILIIITSFTTPIILQNLYKNEKNTEVKA